MDVHHLYAFATTGYLTLQSLPLLFTPSLIVSLLASEPRRITDLETYLCRSSAFTLLAFAVLILLLTGVIPSTNSWDASATTNNGSDAAKTNPYAQGTAVITTVYHALTSFYIYMQIASSRSRSGTFAFYAGLTFSATLFCFGIWVILFAGEKGSVSRKTGADKRTGNWPFGNKESAREIKKESRREEKEREKEKDRDGKSDKEGREKEKEKEKSKRRSVTRGSSWR
ncbi:hypothetical protein LTR86_005548 [Recurvomyces mirabilis]|nr:hypothetical protein LTR86_005548 [Recurvomyces mirabilis]